MSTSFGFTSTAEEVAAAFANEVRGKNVLITGTSLNGLGFETARVIAKYAALVIITGYNTERLKLAEAALKQEIPSANIRPLILNLASLANVHAAAAEVNAYPENIDVLINNAASSICTFKLTQDGFEQQLATDHLGPFLFTALVLPKVLAAQSAVHTPRVVYVASGSHAWCDGVDLAVLEQPDVATYKAMTAYAQAKSANILTASELARRAAGRIHAYSLSPGAIATNLTENPEAREELLAAGIITEDGKPNRKAKLPWKTLPQGASTIVVAAFDPSLNDKNGCYLKDCAEENKSVAPHTADPVMAEKLWALSERLVDVKFL
ncbi:NAD-P-binding protein [Mycena rosella]|uniref:NAD-P-binding protein n=1 Tax=Mycena rosella TaxID=1033263 RepID=A0AAD7DP54_MYCRO|nr:NAD-P-binding protein [Mycena rosella]